MTEFPIPLRNDTVQAIRWNNGELQLLDQRLLPAKEVYLKLVTPGAVARAISDMVVRGAPAIGIVAAYGVVLSANMHFSYHHAGWKSQVEEDIKTLSQSRPTAVNLFWALKKMLQAIHQFESSDNFLLHIEAEAVRIHESDIAANAAMGELGGQLIHEDTNDGDAIITHCNTGALATGGFGTALGVIRSAYELGAINRVYVDETRPWLQGARLTAWELQKDQIPHQIIADGAAAYTMNVADVGWAVVGADRVAANGDVANKIGTYNLAVAAHYHNVRFMVVAPSTTIDLTIAAGEDIPIEERCEKELLEFRGIPIAPGTSSAFNPVFDVTPFELIDVLVTERGVIENPTADKIAALMCKAKLH